MNPAANSSTKSDGLMSASPLRLSLRVFAVFTAVYLCSWAGHYTTGDGAIKIAWTKAMLFGRATETGSTETVVSKYGIGHSLLAIPPIGIAHFIQKTIGVR